MKVSKSITDPLKQPTSVIIAFLGGAALFNSCIKLGFVDASAPIDFFNRAYVWFRDFIFWPVETAIKKDISIYLKNAFLIYMVFARAFWSAINFLNKEYNAPPDQDIGFRNGKKTFLPFEKGFVAELLKTQSKIVQKLTNRNKVRQFIHMAIGSVMSLSWPLGIVQLLRYNRLNTEYTGPETVGTPHPSSPFETELPPMGEHGFMHSPKHPAPGRSEIGIYESRKMILTFVSIQLSAFIILLLINAILLHL